VDVQEALPDAVVHLRYATPANFLGRAVYPSDMRCRLVPEAAQRLAKAAQALRALGFRLYLYDCHRPLSVQWEMWKRFPKPGYVANPRFGSHHNRGAAVDVGLASMEGQEVEMPTPFDTFSKRAHHGDGLATPLAKKHRELLRQAMEGAGFRKNRMEWWHYELPNARTYPLR
jgi:D-alanyl-D-alanine dipeptidase